MATEKKTPAETAQRPAEAPPEREVDVKKAAVQHAASTAGERSTYEDAEPTSEGYGGPFIQQHLAPRADGE
jgi:hypothetical protein